MKILAIVNTSYQMIVVAHLRKQLFADAEMDIIITDQVPDGDRMAQRVEQTDLFDKVLYVRDKSELQDAAFMDKVVDILQFSLAEGKRFSVDALGLRERYDELLYYNFDLFAIRLFDTYVKRNPQIKLCRFEEGFLSYNTETAGIDNNSRRAWILRLRKLLKIKKNWEPYFHKYYCFFPWLIRRETGYALEQIPTIQRQDADMIQLLDRIFDYKPDPMEYRAKVIYFEGWFKCGEQSIVQQIVDAVGKENIVVKPHPRHKTDWEKRFGVRTSTNDHMPWEIVQMNLDVTGSVLVAVSSSCPAVGSAILGDDVPALYLFPCVQLQGTQNDTLVFQDVTQTLADSLERLQSRNVLPRVKIVKSQAQFQDELSKLQKGALS